MMRDGQELWSRSSYKDIQTPTPFMTRSEACRTFAGNSQTIATMSLKELYAIVSRQITFAQLERALINAGFAVSPSTGSHEVFKHPPTKTTVVLPAHEPDGEVKQAKLAAVMRLVAESGIVDRDFFDALLVDT